MEVDGGSVVKAEFPDRTDGTTTIAAADRASWAELRRQSYRIRSERARREREERAARTALRRQERRPKVDELRGHHADQDTMRSIRSVEYQREYQAAVDNNDHVWLWHEWRRLTGRIRLRIANLQRRALRDGYAQILWRQAVETHELAERHRQELLNLDLDKR